MPEILDVKRCPLCGSQERLETEAGQQTLRHRPGCQVLVPPPPPPERPSEPPAAA